MQNDLNLGQHFLINNDIINNMITLSDITKDDYILEIGAGLGVLSKRIAPLCKNLQIVEIDTRLKPYLNAIASNFDNLKIEYTNALKYDFSSFNKIITSLPYNILEPFIFKCVKQKVDYIVMLIGDKYALGLKDNNEQTITHYLTKTFFDCYVCDYVSKDCFDPPPRTASYIVKLIRKKELNNFDYIMAEIFMQSDKKIKTALKESIIRLHSKLNKTKTQKQAKQIIEQLNINENVLESFFSNLTNEQFSTLYKTIKANMHILEN